MPDLEQVYSLIKAMYEQEECKEWASKWLEALQRSVFAWKISDQLLIKKIDYQSCYFAAQTLKTKILQSYTELPVESYDSLKDSLINHLINMNVKPIETQLCLSLTYIFYINENWKHAFEELSQKLTKGTFIEILTCIAQEYDESRPIFKLPRARRDQLEQYMSNNFSMVIQLLISCFQELRTCNDTAVQEFISQKCLSCFESWVNFAKNDHVDLVRQMLTIIFEFLKNPDCSIETHEKASDAFCKVIYQCEAHSNFSDLRVQVIEMVYALETSYDNALAVEDSSKLMDLARIFVELGNSIIEFLIYDQIDLKIMQLILKCVGHYEFEVVEITFSFWYNFSEILRKHDYAKFAPYYNHLFTSLSRLCRLEVDSEIIVDEKSDVYDYRSQIHELIQEIAICIDWVNYTISMNVMENFNSTTTSWEIIEAHLYIMYCIAYTDNIDNDNNPLKNDVLSAMINYLLNLPNQSVAEQQQPQQQVPHVQIYATGCDLIAELNEWINDNTNFLHPVIIFLLNIITTNHVKLTKLSIRAAIALKQVLSTMTNIVDYDWISKLFNDLIQIYKLIEDRVELGVPIMACCTAILSNENIEKCEQQETFFQLLLQNCLDKIQVVLNQKLSIEEHKLKWEKVIDNIYAAFKNFRPNDKTKTSTVIHAHISENIWPFLKESIVHFAPIDTQVIEHCSRCVRHIVRSMKPSYLLQPIVDHIVPLYQNFPSNSSLLYIGAVLVDEFADPNNLILADGLIRMLNAFSMTTFHILNENTFNLNPYMIDDYFNLCTRTMTNLPEKFLTNVETLNGIVNLAIMCLYLPQKEASESINKFLIEFFKLKHPVVTTQYAATDFGRNIFFSLIDSIMFKLPSYFIADMVDTIWTFKCNYAELYDQYLQYTTENLYQKIQKEKYNISHDKLKDFYESLRSANNAKQMASEIRHLQRFFNSR
ncbi:Transportin-3 [Dermatophagoides farinae]|uniref:Transportin-3 n=1 Tax=Dermatophagoides farinae TaxID=6954 RepID=A0A922HVI5_DERFA|nr:Transportin-3 [Dermatophagoides farinae]